MNAKMKTKKKKMNNPLMMKEEAKLMKIRKMMILQQMNNWILSINITSLKEMCLSESTGCWPFANFYCSALLQMKL